ncbi:MAG: hypothetical protein K1X33_09480 [Methanobacteriaceae archaeon]|nr:hypothetical protein [Methanobacteriaceae archaeon]
MFVATIVMWSLSLVLIGLALAGEKLAGVFRGLMILIILLMLLIGLALLYYNWGSVALSGFCAATR